MGGFSRVAGVLLLTLSAGGVGFANICALDNAPAATLLFPFAVIDYNDPIGGESTLMTITNVSWQSQIIRISVWTDTGVPLLNFNVILTGYDTIRIDARQVFLTGQLPVTFWQSHQDDEGVQDRGPISSANLLNPGPDPFLDPPDATTSLGDRCSPTNVSYPGLYTTPIPQAFLSLFQGYLQMSQTTPRYYSDDCSQPFANPYTPTPTPWFSTRSTDTSTWFFVTADVVDRCSRLFPDAVNYFIDDARTDNVLIGDVTWVSSGGVSASPAVHLEADFHLGAVATTHPMSGFPISFYHRYAVLNDGVSDYREPLPTAWTMRYQGIGTDYIGTTIYAWKGSTAYHRPLDLEATGADPYSPDELVATNCLAYTYYAWDEDENVVSVTQPAVEINQLPLVTQRVSAEEFQLPGADGWMLVIWPPSNWTAGAVGPPDFWQTWMGSSVDYPGLGKVFMPANPTANYGCFSDQVSPFYGIDYDYVDANGYRASPGVDRDRARRRVR